MAKFFEKFSLSLRTGMIFYLEKSLQISGFFVSKVKKAMSWMMRMKAHLCTCRAFSAFDTHLERSLATDAKLEFALSACEMHATAFGEGVTKFAAWTLNSMFLKVFFHPFSLVIGVIGFFPGCKIFARQSFMSRFPLEWQIHMRREGGDNEHNDNFTGNKHFAQDIARQSGHTSFLLRGSAMNPEEHWKMERGCVTLLINFPLIAN